MAEVEFTEVAQVVFAEPGELRVAHDSTMPPAKDELAWLKGPQGVYPEPFRPRFAHLDVADQSGFVPLGIARSLRPHSPPWIALSGPPRAMPAGLL